MTRDRQYLVDYLAHITNAISRINEYYNINNFLFTFFTNPASIFRE